MRPSPAARPRISGRCAAPRRADIVVVLRKTFPGPCSGCCGARRAGWCSISTTPSSATPTARPRARACALRRDGARLRPCAAGNGFLAAACAAFNPAVTVVPTCVDAGRYRVDRGSPGQRRPGLDRQPFDAQVPGGGNAVALRLAAARCPACAEDHRRFRPARRRPGDAGHPLERRPRRASWAPRTSASPRCATTTGAAASAR
jgi:hypothetical protein